MRKIFVAGVSVLLSSIVLLIIINKPLGVGEHLQVTKMHPNNAKLRNKQVIVSNTDIFGIVTVDIDIIVLRLSEKDTDPLKTVSVLQKVVNIDETLVILSHGSFDAKRVSLLDTIRWCRILQIFYLGKKSAVHHWRWTVREVMSHLPWSKKHKGLVVLLESGEIPSSDILYILQYMRAASHDLPAPRLLSLAGVSKDQVILSSQLTIVPWNTRLARGVALERLSWLQLSSTCDVPRTVVTVQCSRVIPPSQHQINCTKELFPKKVELAIQLDGLSIVYKTGNLQRSTHTRDPRDFFWCRRISNNIL